MEVCNRDWQKFYDIFKSGIFLINVIFYLYHMSRNKKLYLIYCTVERIIITLQRKSSFRP